MLSLTQLFWLFLLALAGCYWWSAHGVKERAFRAVKDYCRRVDVVMLDDSLVLRGFWFKRDAQGSLRVWRSFLFEFTSTGDERYRGRVVMLGRAVDWIELEPHRMEPQDPAPGQD